MKIKRVKPVCIHVVTPQCSAKCHPMGVVPYFRERRKIRAARKGFREDLCQASSTYVLNGKPYCAKHAGIVALEILMKEKK